MFRYTIVWYILNRSGATEYAGKSEKGEKMNKEMSLAELLKETAEENQTRKILEILNNSSDLEDAKEKVRALLNK